MGSAGRRRRRRRRRQGRRRAAGWAAVCAAGSLNARLSAARSCDDMLLLHAQMQSSMDIRHPASGRSSASASRSSAARDAPLSSSDPRACGRPRRADCADRCARPPGCARAGARAPPPRARRSRPHPAHPPRAPPPQRSTSTRYAAGAGVLLGCAHLCLAEEERGPSGATFDAVEVPRQPSRTGTARAAPALARETHPPHLPDRATGGCASAHFKPRLCALWGWGACGSAPAGLLSEVGSVVLQQLTAGARWHGHTTRARWPPFTRWPSRARWPPLTLALTRAIPPRALAHTAHAPSALVPVAQASTLSCARSTTTCRTSRTSRGASRRRESRNLSC